MRTPISSGLFLLLSVGFVSVGFVACGGRTLLDDNELPLGIVHGGPAAHDSGAASPPAGEDDASVGGQDDAATAGGVACGAKTCTSNEDCCVVTSGTSASSSCTPKGKCAMGIVAMCTSGADCPSGEVCCGSLGAGGGGGGSLGGFSVSISCARSCAVGLQLCAMDSECAKGVTCQSVPVAGAKACGGLSSLGALAGLLGGAAGGAGGFGGGGGGAAAPPASSGSAGPPR